MQHPGEKWAALLPLFTELPRRLLLVVSYAGGRVEREVRPLLDPVSELELTPLQSPLKGL